MSNQAPEPIFNSDDSAGLQEMTLAPRTVQLTPRSGIEVRRTLPHKFLRTIGAWCFVDHYGPADSTQIEGRMSVAAHPHVGLQTVTWLFSGEVEHRDSIGSNQIISPGELNIMTAGHGIAHSEISTESSKELHGLQLWTVLSDSQRDRAPSFNQYRNLPVFDLENLHVRLFVGEFLGHHSEAQVYSDLLGAEIDLGAGTTRKVDVDDKFEYGVLLVTGDLTVNSEEIPLSHLHYIPSGRKTMSLSSHTGAKVVLLGGSPFAEKIIMWWNFIGRTHEEIQGMQQDWNNREERFPSFDDRIHGRIPAPPLPNVRLSPRSNNRIKTDRRGM